MVERLNQEDLMFIGYANRIPLLYDEGSDVVFKVVNDTDWGTIQSQR